MLATAAGKSAGELPPGVQVRLWMTGKVGGMVNGTSLGPLPREAFQCSSTTVALALVCHSAPLWAILCGMLRWPAKPDSPIHKGLSWLP